MKLHLNYSIVLLLLLHQCYCDADPTDGFTEIPLNETNLQLQKPYNVPLDQRYSFINGTHHMWVYADDKPYSLGSNTKPRTEIRFVGLDYSSGAWQFEGHGFVPNGTSGATIAQIHGARKGNTTLLLRIYAPGEMRYYSSLHVAATLYDRWFRLNIIHDVDLGKVSVYLDGEKKFEHKDQGPGDLYFKCGVYGAPSNISYYMEARWRDLKIYYKK
ncbi:Citrate-binding protein [Linum perenne]